LVEYVVHKNFLLDVIIFVQNHLREDFFLLELMVCS
jgi:hypothetical protein